MATVTSLSAGTVAVALSICPEKTMPYATGETPLPGDYVKNEFEQPGTVTRLRMASNGEDFVSIRWDPFADVGYSGNVIAELKGGDETYLKDMVARIDRLLLSA